MSEEKECPCVDEHSCTDDSYNIQSNYNSFEATFSKVRDSDREGSAFYALDECGACYGSGKIQALDAKKEIEKLKKQLTEARDELLEWRRGKRKK